MPVRVVFAEDFGRTLPARELESRMADVGRKYGSTSRPRREAYSRRDANEGTRAGQGSGSGRIVGRVLSSR